MLTKYIYCCIESTTMDYVFTEESSKRKSYHESWNYNNSTLSFSLEWYTPSAISFPTFCVVSDINECDLNIHNCSNNAHCFNTHGSFVCNCSGGFSGNGVICEGIRMLTVNFL